MLVLTVNRVLNNSKIFVEKIFVNCKLSTKFANISLTKISRLTVCCLILLFLLHACCINGHMTTVYHHSL